MVDMDPAFDSPSSGGLCSTRLYRLAPESGRVVSDFQTKLCSIGCVYFFCLFCWCLSLYGKCARFSSVLSVNRCLVRAFISAKFKAIQYKNVCGLFMYA